VLGQAVRKWKVDFERVGNILAVSKINLPPFIFLSLKTL